MVASSWNGAAGRLPLPLPELTVNASALLHRQGLSVHGHLGAFLRVYVVQGIILQHKHKEAFAHKESSNVMKYSMSGGSQGIKAL